MKFVFRTSIFLYIYEYLIHFCHTIKFTQLHV